jgi:hypothetical protein
VVGGCFCCRFYDLVSAIQALTEATRPDIILAEPVGSCTDLVATVLKPLEQNYPDAYDVAPFTVLVDPSRHLEGFPASMDDLFHWQIAEADIIALSKADLFGDAEWNLQLQRFHSAYPNKQIIGVSSRSGTGIAEWITKALVQSPRLRNVVPVDYIVYAEAEACLGWLNATLHLTGALPFSLQQWITQYLAILDEHLQRIGAEIAHVKVHARAGGESLKASLTASGQSLSWDLAGDGHVTEVSLILNARVRCEPDDLLQAVQAAAQRMAEVMDVNANFVHVECFSPAPPQPTFRLG